MHYTGKRISFLIFRNTDNSIKSRCASLKMSGIHFFGKIDYFFGEQICGNLIAVINLIDLFAAITSV